MKPSAVSVEQRGALATVTMDQPSLTRELGFGLAHAVNTMARIDEVRVIVVTGRKNVFLSGVDLQQITRLNSATTARRILEVPRLLFQRLITCPKPTIAAINGFCLGAGAELALACDLRVAVDAVRDRDGESVPYLGFLHVQRGMTPHLGGTQILPRLVGPARAKELLMTARVLGAAEALRIGLVDQVASPARLFEAVGDLASVIARNDPAALRRAKELVHHAFAVRSVDDGLRGEREAFARCLHVESGEPAHRLLPWPASASRGA
ncbi:MAG TPA: enoyl-CoA hydratase/isomerase family protein [Vicinamibacteria bacterium]|jgi:enoyl-CoA hydratase